MTEKEFFKENKNVAVAFSGGVDSSVLLLLAKRYCENVKAYFVKSSFQPEFEYEDALAVTRLLDVETEVIRVDVLSDKDIVKNPDIRCYYCKKRIFEAICKAAEKDGFNTVLEGTNASDDISDRPGFAALKEMGILSPLREFGYTKKQIRTIARENRLPVADKPSYACLATRIPTGIVITKEILEKTEKAEGCLRNIGFKNFRLRYLDGAAKLELGEKEFELLYKNRERVTTILSPYYENVYIDLRERADE